MNITVIGGGLAGISAALVLADSGFDVRLLERSQRLGGRASSIYNNRLGIEIDRGQHAFLGCCTNLLDLYRRIGVTDCIEFHESMAFLGDTGTKHLCGNRFPEPLHLLPSLLASDQLTWRDKVNAGKLMFRPAHRVSPDIPASRWLSGLGQSDRSLSNFWGPVLTAALNESLETASARHASQVIRLAMLSNAKGFQMGVPQVPLSEIHDIRTKHALEAAGVSVQVGELVLGIDSVERGGFDIRSFKVATKSKEIYSADRVIVATNPTSRDLIPSDTLLSMNDHPAQSKPVQVPIITLYLWFSEPIKLAPITCMPHGRFQWCFDRTRISPQLPGMASGISLVCSAARDLTEKTDAEIVSIGTGELNFALGEICPKVRRASVVRSKAATFSPFAGCDDVRPTNRTTQEHMYVAGEWTATGWPGTMESAVRSGYTCASEILRREGMKCEVPLPDIERHGLAKLLL